MQQNLSLLSCIHLQFVSFFGTNCDYQLLHAKYHRGQYYAHFYFSFKYKWYAQMLQYLHHFTDDTTLLLNNPNIPNLETNLNVELENVNQWSYANKLSKPALWYSFLDKEEQLRS